MNIIIKFYTPNYCKATHYAYLNLCDHRFQARAWVHTYCVQLKVPIVENVIFLNLLVQKYYKTIRPVFISNGTDSATPVFYDNRLLNHCNVNARLETSLNEANAEDTQ